MCCSLIYALPLAHTEQSKVIEKNGTMPAFARHRESLCWCQENTQTDKQNKMRKKRKVCKEKKTPPPPSHTDTLRTEANESPCHKLHSLSLLCRVDAGARREQQEGTLSLLKSNKNTVWLRAHSLCAERGGSEHGVARR